LRSEFRRDALQTVERSAPALAMAVAGRLIEELLVGQDQKSAVSLGLQGDRDQRLTLWR
jgi:hypothetical protein